MINHKQVIFAREYRGYTQTDLAKHVDGLSQSNLSKFEKGLGENLISEEVFERIFSFLDFPNEFFRLKIYNADENSNYRKRSRILKKDIIDIESSNKFIGYLIDRFSESVEFPEFRFKTIDIEEGGYRPEEVATFVRKQLKLNDEPVANINTLLEQHGVIIVERESTTDLFDGVSFVTDGGKYVIIINKNASNDRKRRTIAHELGHLIMHANEDYIISEDRNKELETDRFANEFLMPQRYITSYLQGLKLSHLASIKERWLVSMASIIRRAYDLKQISKGQYTYYNIEMAKKGYKQREPVIVPIDKPIAFNQAYQLHRQELNYSDLDCVEAFHLPIDIIHRYCEMKPTMRIVF